ncbi:MAG: cholesterol esterase [Candidatus Dormibacteraeota bacterium]|nr:cholesterol esterase [Candidatus Dormibacteraeota bacterium]
MRGPSGDVMLGSTRWRRFGAVMLPVFAVMGFVVYLVSSGAMAVSFAISNSSFQVDADSLTNTSTDSNGVGFYQVGVVDWKGDGTFSPQVETIIPSAKLTNLCQSVTVLIVTLRITAGDNGTPATATNLVTDTSNQAADSVTFNNVQIGQDMSQYPNLTVPTSRGSGPNVNTGPVAQSLGGNFGQVASGVTITGLKSVSAGTSASSFTLPHLSMGFGDPCTKAPGQ